MPPAPIPHDEARRLKALLDCNVLDSEPDPAFDDLTRLAARICDTPIALVSLVDSRRQWFKSRIGFEAAETPRHHALCAYAILGREPFIIRDAATDPRTRDNALVTSGPGVRFYAGFPIELGSGAVVGTLCVMDTRPRDLSLEMIAIMTALAQQAATQLEFRRTIARLEAATADAQRASEAKSRLLASVSHEIRTPLTAILGFADVMLDPRTEPHEMREHAQTIKTGGAHLLALVNDLLDLSRIEAGRFPIYPTPTCLAALVDEVMQLLSVRAAEKSLAFMAVYESPVPRDIAVDPLRLRQILTNLLSNGIKFTKQGAVTLRVSYDAAAGRMDFIVSDTGPGLAPADIEQLFCAFTQGEATTRRYGGSGLGLHVSQRLAELMGGEICVQSTPGAGSEFTLRLPVTPCGAEAESYPAEAIRSAPTRFVSTDAPPEGATSGVEAPPAPLEHIRIYVVEDLPDIQRVIRHYLASAGAEVSMFANGRELLDELVSAEAKLSMPPPCDLILSDIQMPEVDGHAVVARLRGLGWPGPIVALTAHAMTADAERCLSEGFNAYIAKPVERGALIETCRALVGAGTPAEAASA